MNTSKTMSVIAKGILVFTIGIMMLTTTSCSTTKATASTGSEECNMQTLMKEKRETEKNFVKTLDNLWLQFQGLNKDITTSDKPFLELFDEKMQGMEDTLTVSLKSIHEKNDQQKICTSNQANARWSGWQLAYEDANQERVREMLKPQTKNNFNSVFQNVFLASEYNFYLMRGEPISEQKQKLVREVFEKYAPVSLKGKSFEEIREAFIKSFNLQVKKTYTGSEAVEFRAKWAARVLRNELRNRMLESRLQQNR